MSEKIWLSTPHMGGNELKYIQEAFDSNWVAPLGPNVEGFEKDLESFLGNDVHVAALSSGTAALHLALIQLGVGLGDEVICQSMTFSASANPIAYLGAQPVFVDSEEESWNMCPHALKEAIEDRIQKGKTPKAIIVVHLYGMPAKMDEIMDVANAYGIPVIEDAAEALGSEYKGQKCGTFGQFGVLSFNGNKIITTSGGGALVCKSKEAKAHTIFLSTQARDNAPHYEHSHIGYNYRLSNVSAGIGRGQMEVLLDRIAARRSNHAFYVELLQPFANVTVFSEPNQAFYSNHWLSALVINDSVDTSQRKALRLHLLEQNIESRPLWKPMHLQPVFKDCPYYGNKVAETLFEKGLCLPSGSNLTDQERSTIKSSMEQFFKTR